MAIDVRIPTLGESVSEGIIARWIKADGDAVQADEPLLELETDKASVEIPAEGPGVLKILKAEGETVKVGDVVARIEDGAAARPAASKAEPVSTPVEPGPASQAREGGELNTQHSKLKTSEAPFPRGAFSPAVRRLVEEHDLDPQAINATGRGGRLTKADVLAHLEQTGASGQPSAVSAQPEAVAPTQNSKLNTQHSSSAAADEERVPMSHLRQRIAERLVQAQHTAAILTTFNEVDLTAVMELRARHKERFSQVHGVSLGFMSFFARACIGALQDMPLVNAQIDGSDIVYKKYVNLGVAVSTERGLVVPVVHGAEQLSFAEIEKEIERLASLARQNKLGIDNLSGGTFTISNGGVFGSLLSTPILNPPQSAILGMHKIQKRPVALNDQIVIRPMMYLALSYDHRLIDGEHAVRFLVQVKERLEDPSRMLLEI